MCTSDSTLKHTIEISVPFSSASNVKNSTLIPCFPQREKEQGTERPSLSSYSYRSHLVDGLIEQRRDIERQRQREKEAQVLKKCSYLTPYLQGRTKVTFSVSHARSCASYHNEI